MKKLAIALLVCALCVLGAGCAAADALPETSVTPECPHEIAAMLIGNEFVAVITNTGTYNDGEWAARVSSPEVVYVDVYDTVSNVFICGIDAVEEGVSSVYIGHTRHGMFDEAWEYILKVENGKLVYGGEAPACLGALDQYQPDALVPGQYSNASSPDDAITVSRNSDGGYACVLYDRSGAGADIYTFDAYFDVAASGATECYGYINGARYSVEGDAGIDGQEPEETELRGYIYIDPDSEAPAIVWEPEYGETVSYLLRES